MSIQVLFGNIINKFSVQPVIDSKIVQYVVQIMNDKNAQLGRPAFTTIMIMKLPEVFITIPNAAAMKAESIFLSIRYLYLTSTTLDILEHLVLNEENQTYTLTYIAPYSPYTMKVVLTKQKAERMMRAIIEHELGHLYYPHHCRKYAPMVLAKLGLWLGVALIGLYNTYKGYLFSSVICGYAFNWNQVLIFLGVYNLIIQCKMLFNSSFISSAKWEEEADEFIAADRGILQGMIAFQEIALKAQTYIYSYTNWWIRLHAWFKRMDCAEFVKANRKIAHGYFEKSSSFGEAYHPMQEDRIARLQERITQIPTEENSIVSEPITITVYRGTQIVDQSII